MSKIINELKLEWRHTEHIGYVTSVVVDDKGFVYTYGYGDGLIKKITPDGKTVWTYNLGHGANPMLGKVIPKDNYIYASRADNKISKIDKDGKLIWERSYSQGTGIINIVIDEINKDEIYVCLNRAIIKIDENGEFIRKVAGISDVVDFRVDSLGNMYYLTYTSDSRYTNNLIRINQNGTSNILVKKSYLNKPVNIGVDKDGNVFITSRDQQLEKFSSDGKLLWSYKPTLGNYYAESIEVDEFGNVYIGDRNDNTIFKINSQGKEEWRFLGGEGGLGTNRVIDIALDKKGYVYTASAGEVVQKISNKGYIIPNEAPKISGSNLDYGSVTDNFEIDYLVTDPDENDKVKVTVELIAEGSIGEIKQTHDEITLGAKYKYLVPVRTLPLGNYILKIKAVDLIGEEDVRIFYFARVNSAPTIKIYEDTQLGNRNTGFTLKYQVDDINNDKLSVAVRINKVQKEFKANVAHNEDLFYTVTKEELSKYPLNQENIIEFDVKDELGATVYERFKFTRTNSLPEISGVDRNLGEFDKAFNVDYSVSDQEGDKVYASVFLDDKEVVEFGEVEEGKLLSYKLSEEQYLKLEPGITHKIRIEATDQHTIDLAGEEGTPEKVKREFTFKKKWTDVEVIFDIGESIEKIEGMDLTDENGKIILAGRTTTLTLTPEIYMAGGATANYFATNNGYDENPVWEEVTNIVYGKSKHFFKNKIKTSVKWNLKIKVVGKRNVAVENSRFRALAGSFGFIEHNQEVTK